MNWIVLIIARVFEVVFAHSVWEKPKKLQETECIYVSRFFVALCISMALL